MQRFMSNPDFSNKIKEFVNNNRKSFTDRDIKAIERAMRDEPSVFQSMIHYLLESSGVDVIGELNGRMPSYYYIYNDIIKYYKVPEALNIGNCAFQFCTNLERVDINDEVIDIGYEAFSECLKLKFVKFSDAGRLKTIGNEAFYHCESLHSIDLPEGLEEIGSSAFAYSGLKSVYLPSTLGWISDCAFKFCTDLISVIYNGTKNDFLNNVMKSSRWDEDVKIHSISCRDGILQWQ